MVTKLLRYFLYLVTGYLLFKIIAQAYKSYKQSQLKGNNARKSAGSRKVIRGEMVKDPMCNTYIPKDSSIKETIGEQTFYFCSHKCREQFKKKFKSKE